MRLIRLSVVVIFIVFMFSSPVLSEPQKELPVTKLPGLSESGESYFSPDSQYLIMTGKAEGETIGRTYVVKRDGSVVKKINDKGYDACSYFFPKSPKLIFTSTRDHPDLPKGNWSRASEYPQGAELYVSDLDGANKKRLTDNKYYDAEVSVSPDEKWILFTRQMEGKLDLWRMKVDGSEEQQLTHTDEWQEGGSFFMPDGKTVIFRAWLRKDETKRGMPMAIFTMNPDGSNRRQVTSYDGTHWAPYPTPDGKHFAYVKRLEKHNFEIFLMNIESKKEQRLTFNKAFDGYPSISPDGKTMSFTSSRQRPKKERKASVFLMDISSLNLQ